MKDFNRFVHHEPIKWSDLPQDCIYKLERVNVINDRQISANFTNADGITISVLLPQFVLDRLISLNETNVDIYIKSKGKEQVDITSMPKEKCMQKKL